MKYRIFVDSFSGAAADLKRGQRNAEGVLAALAKNPRVSVWDMSEHAWLRNSIADLERRGLIAEQGEPYPWLRYKVVTPNLMSTPKRPVDRLLDKRKRLTQNETHIESDG